jgi:WD40 repeat protein
VSARASMRALAVVAPIAVGFGATPTVLRAQYFGQNHVEYQTFNFRVLKTQHFDIYYYPEEEPAVGYAARIAERAYARLSRLLDHQLSTRQPLILYASGPQFGQTNVVQGTGDEGTGGVTETLKRRIVMPFAGPLKETDHVLTHELVHAFQFDMTGAQGGVLRAGGPSVDRMPLWFVEGMAEYLSIGPRDANTAMWMRDAVRAGELPDLRHLEDPRFFPYRYGQALWAYVGGRWGDDAVGRVLKAGRRGDLRAAFQQALYRSADSVVHDWQTATREAFAPLADVTQPPNAYGRGVIVATKQSGGYNLAPALSPDGSRLVFLSSRDLFSIDMYLADARTGKILKRIVRTDVDPHFESIEFISSAGAWNAGGERFAFAAVRNGRPELAILNVPQDRIEREIPLPDLGEATNPTWSPDGRYLAFSALVGGLSDLYVYDLRDSTLRRLTNDAYADLQPAWSPDGRYIAWVTDRYSTNLDTLSYGDYRLGLFDMQADTAIALPAFGHGKQINPQWSPDGKHLYFISDQNGISNVYRLDVSAGRPAERITQVTNLYAGAAGVTELSPALSVAARSGDLAFSVYAGDGYSIYVANDPAVLAGQPVLARLAAADPAMLPPQARQSQLLALKQNSAYGLPADTSGLRQQPYHARFGLDYIGQPSLVVGADRFGTYIGGGASLFWSDMLGGHTLATALQVQGGLRDVSALLGYSNTYHRLNWGVTLQQVPYLTGAVGFADTTVGGVPVLIEQTLLFRETDRQASLAFAYPFSRVRRVEGQIGYENIGYGIEQENRYIDPEGNVIGDVKTNLPSPSALNLGQASAALVYDNSIVGFTGPILGQRYRLELGATQGDLGFLTLLGDYRRYWMPARPFTLAARVVHFGRYGGAAESGSLQPLFIGYDGLVRGYELGSFDFSKECASASSCPVYTNLFGSKMLVGNVEVRFPPLGVFKVGGPFGSVPVDLFMFGDAGLAWNSGSSADKAFFLGGDRRPVYSAGVGLRVNLLGFAIGEVDLVHPFNRPMKGTYLRLGFTPGF